MFPFNRPLSFVLSTIPYYVLGARELLRRRQSHICPGKRVHKKTQTIKGRQVTGGQTLPAPPPLRAAAAAQAPGRAERRAGRERPRSGPGSRGSRSSSEWPLVLQAR
ncbi:hypothetical protein R6Z07M_006229 [Ovis aries]